MPHITSKKDFITALTIWDAYNSVKGTSQGSINQTKQFFNEIDLEQKETFLKSSNKVVQLGCSDGNYISLLPDSKKIVGYDYAKKSMIYLNKSNMQRRYIDLDETINEGTELSYASELVQDLNVPTDILCIRVLEYLAPDSMSLLLFALINNAKPLSIFYIELSANKPKRDGYDELERLGIHNSYKSGYVASFFAPRTDFQTLLREAHYKKEGPTEAFVEKFIVQKI